MTQEKENKLKPCVDADDKETEEKPASPQGKKTSDTKFQEFFSEVIINKRRMLIVNLYTLLKKFGKQVRKSTFAIIN